jgi:hypothetical protein
MNRAARATRPGALVACLICAALAATAVSPRGTASGNRDAIRQVGRARRRTYRADSARLRRGVLTPLSGRATNVPTNLIP